MPRGRLPLATRAMAWRLTPSIIVTSPDLSLLTHTQYEVTLGSSAVAGIITVSQPILARPIMSRCMFLSPNSIADDESLLYDDAADVPGLEHPGAYGGRSVKAQGLAIESRFCIGCA